MRYLHKTPEGQLIDMSLQFPITAMSPLAKIMLHLGVPYPNCWIRVRKRSTFLETHLHELNIQTEYKKPGDFDIIAGSLSDGSVTNYMVSIEVKRFRYIVRDDRWILKKPYNTGEMQAAGYTLYGFDRVLLHHFVVAEPVHLPGSQDGAVWLDNAGLVLDGMDAVKRVGIVPTGPYGYSITGWAQVPHKDPTWAGSIPAPYVVTPTPMNPNANDRMFQNIRGALWNHLRQEVEQRLKTSTSLPLIISYKESRHSPRRLKK
jgi:hypothetical protein